MIHGMMLTVRYPEQLTVRYPEQQRQPDSPVFLRHGTPPKAGKIQIWRIHQIIPACSDSLPLRWLRRLAHLGTFFKSITGIIRKKQTVFNGLSHQEK